MYDLSTKPTLCALFIKNKDSDLFTGYIQEIPGVVAQGKSIEDAQRKLFNALKTYLDAKRKMSMECDFPDAVTKSLSIEFA